MRLGLPLIDLSILEDGTIPNILEGLESSLYMFVPDWLFFIFIGY